MTGFVIVKLPASLQGPPHASSTYSEAHFVLLSPGKEHSPLGGRTVGLHLQTAPDLPHNFGLCFAFPICEGDLGKLLRDPPEERASQTPLLIMQSLQSRSYPALKDLPAEPAEHVRARTAGHGYFEKMDRQAERQGLTASRTFQRISAVQQSSIIR